MNTTGFELKSIGDSDAKGRPVSFKEPPPLRGGSKAMAKDAPTAENLKRLNTSAVAKSDTGAKSARSHVSGKSADPERPENKYKNHSVEDMETLIQQTTA